MVQTTVRPVRTVFLTACITIAAARASNPAATDSTHVTTQKACWHRTRHSGPPLLLCAASGKQRLHDSGDQLQQHIHTDTGDLKMRSELVTTA